MATNERNWKDGPPFIRPGPERPDERPVLLGGSGGLDPEVRVVAVWALVCLLWLVAILGGIAWVVSD